MAATDDYKLSAPLYQETLDNQGRTEAPLTVESSQQFDRDNLLHFIEDKFKSNVRGGVSIYNLRTLLHSIVKSFVNVKDDDARRTTLVHQQARLYFYGNQYYYGTSTAGWGSGYWNNYSSTLGGFAKINLNSSYRTEFAVKNISLIGSIKSTSSSAYGDVEVTLAYSEVDDLLSSPSTTPMNVVGTHTVAISSLNDNYPINIVTTQTIPPNKLIFVFFRYVDHPGSGTKYMTFSFSINHSI